MAAGCTPGSHAGCCTCMQVRRGKAGDVQALQRLASKAGDARVLKLIAKRSIDDSKAVPYESLGAMQSRWVVVINPQEEARQADELEQLERAIQRAAVAATIEQLRRQLPVLTAAAAQHATNLMSAPPQLDVMHAAVPPTPSLLTYPPTHAPLPHLPHPPHLPHLP